MEEKIIITKCMSVKHQDRETNCVINYFRVHLLLFTMYKIHAYSKNIDFIHTIIALYKLYNIPKVSVF